MNLMEKYQRKVKEPEAIRWDTLSHIHLQTARQLATEGQNLRLQTPEIAGIENSLNETWHACLKGQASIDDFKAINEKWAVAIRTANKAQLLTF